MKASLNFELPDERVDYLSALHGVDAFATLQDVWNICRRVIKDSDSCSGVQLAERIRNEIGETLTKIEP